VISVELVLELLELVLVVLDAVLLEESVGLREQEARRVMQATSAAIVRRG
jgi:hypothetical protein